MVYIYVLRLEEGKYYIGKTTNPRFRIQDHFSPGASSWTSKYRPIEVVDIVSDGDDYDEDKYTLIYMERYGIENVRGGSFSQVVLTPSTMDTLERMIKTATDKCFNCGEVGHFARDCRNIVINSLEGRHESSSSVNHRESTSSVNPYESNCLEDLYESSPRERHYESNTIMSEYPPQPSPPQQPSKSKKKSSWGEKLVNFMKIFVTCSNCGRDGHFPEDCKYSPPKPRHYQQYQPYQPYQHCQSYQPYQSYHPYQEYQHYQSYQPYQEYQQYQQTPKNMQCFRCGRPGHFISQCFAKTHINGHRI